MTGPSAAGASGPLILLCADDYALTEGVSRGIEELAGAGRLSATSALVTGPHWPAHGARLARLAGAIAIGLHINLTLGRPLTPMPGLAAGGDFPSLGRLVRRALLDRIDRAEIEAEVAAQIDAFARHAGALPDFVDGHQHAHALPVVRDAVLAAIASRLHARPVLVRDPTDSIGAILRRRTAATKALAVAALAAGFGRLARARGLATNEGFAGFSEFSRETPYAAELAAAIVAPGPRHLVMCHPGYPDAELARLDPVTERRRDELETLARINGLTSHILRPHRDPQTGCIDWPRAWSVA